MAPLSPGWTETSSPRELAPILFTRVSLKTNSFVVVVWSGSVLVDECSCEVLLWHGGSHGAGGSNALALGSAQCCSARGASLGPGGLECPGCACGCTPVCAALLHGPVRYPDVTCLTSIESFQPDTSAGEEDQAPDTIHSRGFSVGCMHSYALYGVQARCLLDIHFVSVFRRYLTIHLSDIENFRVCLCRLLQQGLSTPDAGATPCVLPAPPPLANPLPGCASALPSVKWAPLYSPVPVTHSAMGARCPAFCI